MKRIGTTSTGNVLVEMTSEEFDSLDLTICSKTPTAPVAKVALAPALKQMSIKERAEYAIPRIQKSRPKKKASLVKFIEAMFQFNGGIDEPQIEQIIVELKKKKLLTEVERKITYLDL